VAEVAFDGPVAAVASVEASSKKPAAAPASSSSLSSPLSHGATYQSATAKETATATATATATETATAKATATATQERAATTTTPPPSTFTAARRQRTKNYRGEVLPTTTSKQKDNKTVTKIKKGVRVKVQHQVLYHICSHAQQVKLPTNVDNSYNMYRAVMHGASGQCGWDVQFDVFPQEDHTVKNLTPSKIVVVEKREEESEYDRPVDTDPLPSTFQTPSPRPTGGRFAKLTRY
jgi:hypothetical protein